MDKKKRANWTKNLDLNSCQAGQIEDSIQSAPDQMNCLADKEQIIQSKGLSLNRSQCGSCSTKYDTPAGT